MEESELTLPGDIPGLLRRGSPVFFEGDRASVVGYCPARGVCIGYDPGAGDSGYEWVYARKLCLDLTDATGRAHAAWYAAGHEDCVIPTLWGMAHFRGLRPVLDDLDPDDPRKLSDGSRWVDAEALRRVVLHVAGRDG